MKKKECKDINPNVHDKGINAYNLAGIGIGGIIGAGFFLGSSVAVHQAGPSIILAFLFGGVIMTQVLGALTSIGINRPVKGSFRVHTEQILGRFSGYLLGWIIFVAGILTLGSEAIATGVFMKYWFPHVPSAVFAVISIIAVIIINSLGTKYFGYIETVMSFIKISILAVFIVLGAYILFRDGIVVKPNPVGSFHSFFPNGITGFLNSMLIVVFTYSGINALAIAATTDVRKPCLEVPKASIIMTVGIVSLYVISMIVVIFMVDWQAINITISPFVQGFDKMGYNWASALVNFVILIATLSVMIGSFYGCDQMLVSLAEAKEAPQILMKTSKRGINIYSLAATGIITILIVLIGFILGTKLFNYLISSSSYFSFINWIINLVTYIIWLKRRKENELYDSPFIKGRWSAILTIFVIVILMAVSLGVRDFRIGFSIAIIVTIMIAILYRFTNLREKINKNKASNSNEIREDIKVYK